MLKKDLRVKKITRRRIQTLFGIKTNRYQKN